MDTTGNSTGPCAGETEGCAPGTLGTIQRCASIAVDTDPTAGFSPGSTLDVDIYVNAVPNTVAGSGAGPNTIGFDADLHYNQAFVDIVAKSTASAIYYAGAGSIPFSGTNSATAASPDADGSFSMGEIDNGPIGESGAGIMMRITLHGKAAGTSQLTLDYVLGGSPDPAIYDHSGSQIIYTITAGGSIPSTIVVGGACPASAGSPIVAGARQNPTSQTNASDSNVAPASQTQPLAEPQSLPNAGGVPLAGTDVSNSTFAFLIAMLGSLVLMLACAGGVLVRRRLM
jgi:hypothetical protein